MGEIFAGRYELLDPIGHGGMGTIWRAHDLKQGQLVAVKVLRQSDAYSLLRFVREQALRVDHPHVIAPLSWAGEDERVLFTMRIVDGGSLATLIGDNGPLPHRFVAEVLRQILSALRAVHAAGLVHRDLKPANILLDATGPGRPHCYVSDFGIAIDLNGPRLTEAGFVAGTPGYLAPELFLAIPATPAVDMYAVGTLGAVMLTAGTPDQLDPLRPPTGTPSVLWRLLMALRDDEPERRPTLPQAVDQLAHPSLAWTDEAVGEVDVLQQLEPLPTSPVGPTPAPQTTMPRPAPQFVATRQLTVPQPATPDPAEQEPAVVEVTTPVDGNLPSAAPVPGAVSAVSRRRVDWILVGGFTLVLLGGVVLLTVALTGGAS